jgi:hypothetical protein
MRVTRLVVLVSTAVTLVTLNLGCVGRMIGEGVGVVTGASGKVVHLQGPENLEKYKGFQVDSITVSPGLKAPSSLASMVRTELLKTAAKKGLAPTGTPCLAVSGEIINYESADAVDTAVGPLEELMIRAKLTDAGTKQVLAEANLVARAKSTTAGGEKNLSEAAGKALSKWLRKGGLKKGDEEDEKK